MTPSEAQRILREMEATWPRSERNAWTEAQVVVWLKTLAPLDIRDASAALDWCRESCKWLPSHAEFRAGARSAAERRIDAERDEVRALAESSLVPAPPDVAEAYMEKIRRQLSSATGPLARSLRDEFSPEVGA